MLNLRLVEPDLIIDISGLSELKFAERRGNELVIGACVTHGDIEDGRIPDVTRGAMQRVASAIAYRAVRNRGTIGGSLAHADPAADWLTALAALGAEAVLLGKGAERRVPGAAPTRAPTAAALAHADPAADWLTALAALGAEAVLLGKGAERRVPVAQLA